MAFESTKTYRLVKSEDLNHHGTLFAGRCAEWFVESAFICVARKLPPDNIVCLNIHGMEFLRPGRLGDVLCFESRVVYAGRTTIMVYVSVTEEKTPDKTETAGFITFCHVNENTVPTPHKLTILPSTDEEITLFEEALELVAEQKRGKR
jgi:acyl-CoA hydrolase